MSGRPQFLQPRPAQVLAFLKERAGPDGRVPRMARAEACALLKINERSLAAALHALAALGAVTREEGRFAPDGMTPALRLAGGEPAPAASGLAGLGIDVLPGRPRLTGAPVSLPRVRWVEVR